MPWVGARGWGAECRGGVGRREGRTARGVGRRSINTMGGGEGLAYYRPAPRRAAQGPAGLLEGGVQSLLAPPARRGTVPARTCTTTRGCWPAAHSPYRKERESKKGKSDLNIRTTWLRTEK